MEKFVTNPTGYRSEYISNLNRCFSSWGAEKEYNWSFDRAVGDHKGDILLIENEEDGVIAGSAVSYRQLKRGSNIYGIGIMTGSWTLPAARKKGCFTKMIRYSKDLCERKKVSFLTAFVVETNPSSRRLAAAGSLMFPTYHLFSPETPFDIGAAEVEIQNHDQKTYQKIFDTVQHREKEFLSFRYSFPEFVGQYLERIKKTIIIKLNNDFAILEDGVNEVKILLLTYSDSKSFTQNIKVVTNWCLEHKSKKSFFFTTRKELSTICKTLGFSMVAGYFTILGNLEFGSFEENMDSLNINMADKM